MRLPVKRAKSAAFISFRSSPGDETSSVYEPGITSSTSRIVPNSRLKFAQSSCVTPASGSVPCRRPVEKHPQHPRVASAEELDLDHFEPAGGGDALRDFPHAINVKRHESSNLQAMAATTEGPN